jgi:hypothetical protein
MLTTVIAPSISAGVPEIIPEITYLTTPAGGNYSCKRPDSLNLWSTP